MLSTMSDETSPISGNRWEPGDGAEPAQPAVEATEATEATGIPGTTEATAAPPSGRTWLTRARAGVAGGAAAVLLAGGLGGFALGRATAGADDGPGTQQQGVPTGFDRDGDGRGGPGGPQLGQLPDGQVPGTFGQDDGGNDGSDGTDSSDT
jgi:hypothetical protein